MEYQFKFWSLAQVDELVQVWDEAFSDYELNMSISVEQMKNKFVHDRIDFNYSIAAMHGKKYVGFIIHGSEPYGGRNRIYNGGTGVIPAHRGNQLTRKMYEWLVGKKRKEISEFQLEVLDNNHRAKHVYESLNFQPNRLLKTVHGTLKSVGPGGDFEIIEDPNIRWNHWKHLWDYAPAWQSCPNPTPSGQPDLALLLLRKDQKEVGYALIHRGKRRILQMCIDPEHRRQGGGQAIVNHLAQLSEEPWAMINIDEKGSDLINLLVKNGMKPFITQLEMRTQSLTFD